MRWQIAIRHHVKKCRSINFKSDFEQRAHPDSIHSSSRLVNAKSDKMKKIY